MIKTEVFTKAELEKRNFMMAGVEGIAEQLKTNAVATLELFDIPNMKETAIVIAEMVAKFKQYGYNATSIKNVSQSYMGLIVIKEQQQTA